MSNHKRSDDEALRFRLAKQTEALTKHPLDRSRFQMLKQDEKCRTEYVTMVNEVAKAMADDPKFANLLLANLDNVLLTNLFNSNRKELEAAFGPIDGRTAEGRYRKMVHASELFEGTNSLDGVALLHGDEELSMFARVQESDSASSSAGSCNNQCDTSSSLLGCCIVHFWGWVGGGACTPCAK